jgi:hypothetical protein
MMLFRKVLPFSLLLALTIPAGATSLPAVDAGTLADHAELIFVGTVTAVESVPTRDGSYAFTYVSFDIDQSLKGISRGGNAITLRFAGGQVGADLYEIAGAPTFAVGGRHLLFVRGNGESLVPLVGWFQGKYDIVEHPVTRQAMLVDYRGRAVDGVAGGNWRKNGLKLEKDGSLRQPRDLGVSVVSEQGVRIQLEQSERLVDRAAPVDQVLGELRAFLETRKGSARWKASQFVDSASTADVPASFSLTGAPAPTTKE